ncbi:MAG: 4Fe-4S cluster-binding domain-containing protein [Clostridia bacterium]|nr:4Fe-4S cluster-binding domain-containing protein [Clostridia bacterium]
MLSYSHCGLCPRKCGVDRTAGQLGYCKMPASLRAARAAAHYWEEPVISGSFGSGAVFFSGCTLQCKFCQNSDISSGGFGKPLTSNQLRQVFEDLIDNGVQNINLVTPTHFLPDILPALTPKLPVPVVFNCGGYERVETLHELEGKVDIYLPDLKYADPQLAKQLSGAADYFEVAKAAIVEMVRQTGPYVIQDDELKRGVVIRHLVLPGNVGNSLDVLSWIADTFPPHTVLVSLMSQYVPMGAAKEISPFDRRVSEEEYAAVESWMELLGLEDGFTQDFSAASSEYIPPFDLEGLEKY